MAKAKKTKRCCGTCMFWNRSRIISARTGKPTRRTSTNCLWVPPKEFALPVSYRGSPIERQLTCMLASDGEDCRCWKEHDESGEQDTTMDPVEDLRKAIDDVSISVIQGLLLTMSDEEIVGCFAPGYRETVAALIKEAERRAPRAFGQPTKIEDPTQ